MIYTYVFIWYSNSARTCSSSAGPAPQQYTPGLECSLRREGLYLWLEERLQEVVELREQVMTSGQ